MSNNRRTLAFSALFLGLLLVALGVLFREELFGAGEDSLPTIEGEEGNKLTGKRRLEGEEVGVDPLTAGRSNLEVPVDARTGVRGVVLDLKSRQPVGGVQVVALRMVPGLERPVSRFRGLFTDGLWTETTTPPKILAITETAPDGRFELMNLPAGRVFVDARSERAFIRTPEQVRIARGEVKEGLLLLTSPGGRVYGTVTGPAGQPVAGARVSLRPGLNAFLGQLTQRKYRWLESLTDADGKYDIPGVPAGSGYSLTFAGDGMALDEKHGIDVLVGQSRRVDIHGLRGAEVVGTVLDGDGVPVVNAQVAMVYLDFSRMLFSADGRREPLKTDAQGCFAMKNVAPGRVAFIAATDDKSPSSIEELAVVDGGSYRDLVLTLDGGRSFSGLVVDENKQPLPGVEIQIRPFEQSRGIEGFKSALKIRRLVAKSDQDGRFEARGVSGKRIWVQASKPGFATEVRFGVDPEKPDYKIEMTRGVVVRGKVVGVDAEPVTRFRVRTKSKDPKAVGKKSEKNEEGGRVEVRFGGGRRGRGRRGRRGEPRSMRLAEGAKVNGPGGEGREWREIRSQDGTFELCGIPPGDISVDVRAEGYLKTEKQKISLTAGAESELLTFTLERGAEVRGVVVDATTGEPIPKAMVTAYRQKPKKERGFNPFRMNADSEDFDFLGLSAGGNRGSVFTDSQGRFVIRGIEGGHKYRFTARHPDLAKSSVKDVDVQKENAANQEIVIEVGTGGGLEGVVTGAGRKPLANAMVVAFNLNGGMKATSTDANGQYRILGLSPGHYIVFKTRMNESAQDIAMEAMANMRIKTKGVKKGKVTRFDIHDESENGVRVYGVVRDGGEPVKRGMITLLGRDREGIFGMGVRARPTDDKGGYELTGVKPGEYLAQVSRFRRRAEQTSLPVEVPEGVREYRLDIDLPTSHVSGRVIDTAGNAVKGVRVQLGMQDGETDAGGLLGVILSNGVAQTRTDDDGEFKLKSIAKGVYRLTVTGSRSKSKEGYGDTMQENLQVDGVTGLSGLTLTLPRAGTITGTVLNADGVPVVGAEIHYTAEKKDRSRRSRKAMADLFGIQQRPVKSNAQGRFELKRVTPGRYRVRADAKGLSPGTADDVVVAESAVTDVKIRVVKGAKLKVKIVNIDGTNLPLASISVFDSKGKPLASKVSVASMFKQFMKGKSKREDTGWREIGGVPPDTYTVVLKEKGQPELRVTRTIRDGEEVRWEINMAEELKRHRESQGKK